MCLVCPFSRVGVLSYPVGGRVFRKARTTCGNYHPDTGSKPSMCSGAAAPPSESESASSAGDSSLNLGIVSPPMRCPNGKICNRSPDSNCSKVAPCEISGRQGSRNRIATIRTYWPDQNTPPPYLETPLSRPLSHCVLCGIADYCCYTPTSSSGPKTRLRGGFRRKSLPCDPGRHLQECFQARALKALL